MAGTNIDPNELINRQMAAQGLAPQQQQTDQSSIDQVKQVTAEAINGAMDQAEAGSAAKSEADQTFKQPIKIVGPDGKEVELSESQILGTLNRYKDLNYKHMQMKPALAVVEQLMEATGGDATKVAELLKAGISGVAQSGQQQAEPAQKQGAGEDQTLADDFDWNGWANENSVTLPKPLTEMGNRFKQVDANLQQGLTHLNQLTTVVNQLYQAVLGNQQQAQAQQADHATRLVQNNMKMVQQQFGFHDNDEQPFIQFMMERGYTPHDLMDSDFAMKLGNDFKALQSTNDYARLQDIAKRRSAISGSVASTPAAGGAGVQAAPASDFMARAIASRLGVS